MADTTTNIGLTLPGFGEFDDSWWEPLNENFTKIDTEIGALKDEIVDARHSEASLKDFLDVGHNSDGTLKPTEEVIDGRNTFLYGHRDPDSGDEFTLKSQADNSGRELWRAREASLSLVDSLAFREYAASKRVISGSADGNGQPTWMGSTGANINIDGGTTPLFMMIDGYVHRIRTLKQLLLSGASGTKYIYAERQVDGVVTVDGDSTTPPPVSPGGTTAADGLAEMTIFADTTKDFTTEDVKIGDYLTLIDGQDAGTYLILEIAPGGVVSKLKIVGKFPVGGQSNINYTISDRQCPVLGFATAETVTAGRLYIGEADFDGVSITAYRPRNFGDSYISPWQSIDVSAPALLSEIILPHLLGSDKLDISIQVSQADDGSQPVEELSVGQVGNGTLTFTPSNGSLAVDIGTLVTAAVQLSAGDQTVTQQPALSGAPGLTGTVGGALSGTISATRSLAMKWDRNRVYIKGLLSGVFYTDYGGVVRQTGKLRVIARRRG